MASTPVPSQEDPSQQSSHEPKPANTETDLEASATPHQPTNHEQPIAVPVPQTPQTYLTFLLVSGRRRTMPFEPETTIGRVKELVWNAWPSEWQDERPPAPSYLRILHLGKILQDDDTLTKLSFPTSLPPQSQPTDPISHGPLPPSTDSPSATAVPTPVPEPASPTHTTPHHHVHHPHATIVHLSIRSYAPPAEDDLKKDKSRKGWRRANTNTGGNGGERGAGDAVEGGADGEGTVDRGCCGCVIC